MWTMVAPEVPEEIRSCMCEDDCSCRGDCTCDSKSDVIDQDQPRFRSYQVTKPMRPPSAARLFTLKNMLASMS